jgi:hypothetical protein
MEQEEQSRTAELAARLRFLSQEEVLLLTDLVGELRARQVAQSSADPLQAIA